MPIYELKRDSLAALTQVTFASKNILEEDIQRVMRSYIHAIVPNTFVLAEEFSGWTDSYRSIDLLGLEKSGNLVVVELKRTESGAHMELQAIRYAAMVSKMIFSDAVDAHMKFSLKKGNPNPESEKVILEFLDWDEPRGEFAKEVKIVLVSADFNKEITSAVLWLNERGLDIRCVRVRPYEFEGKILVDIQQVLPLPESIDYQVQLRRKVAEERAIQERGLDWTRYDLRVGTKTFSNLYKRQLFLLAIRSLVDRGVSVSDLQKIISPGKFLGIAGSLDSESFKEAISESRTPLGASYDTRRFYLGDDELFHSEGKTWALSNQWSIALLPKLDQLIVKYPNAELGYVPTGQLG